MPNSASLSRSGLSALRTLIEQWRKDTKALSAYAADQDECPDEIDAHRAFGEAKAIRTCADQLEAVCVAQEEQQQEETQTRGGANADSSDSPTAMEKRS